MNCALNRPKINLHLCVPGSGRGPFLAHLVSLAIHTSEAGISVRITNSRSSDLVALRTRIAGTAIAAGATHLLWIDDDMLFPSDAALRLIEHDLPVVVGNYVKKDLNYTPVVANSIAPEDVISSVGKTGLERVYSSGLGFTLVQADVFHKIRFPWFGHRWFHTDNIAQPSIGVPAPDEWGQWRDAFEDTWFFGRLAEANIPVMVDHDLSQQLGHYGGIVYLGDGIGVA